jgi:CRP/FNR family cyclic AMP-dependent transcriptional regulator
MIAAVRREGSREVERRTKELREKLERDLAKDELKKALPRLVELEELDPTNARWPHKRGDVLRRLNQRGEAIAAYEKASTLYSDAGFLPRAIAMAKVIAELSPQRTGVLERIDAGAARELHRRVRPEGVHAGERPATRRVQEEALPLEARPARALPSKAASAASSPRPAVSVPPLPQKPAVPEPPVNAGTRARRLHRERRTTTIDIDISEFELATGPRPDSVEIEIEPDPENPDASREACLPLLPLFAEAPKEALMQLARESELIRLGDGEVVMRKGDPADALYGIVEGHVRVHVPGLLPEARPKLGPGEMFGEACLLTSEPRRADVVAEGDLLALRIPKPTLNYLVRVHEGLADVLFELMTRRLLTNLLSTSGLFAELQPVERKELAGAFELRRAEGGATLLALGEAADAIFVTLTGHVEIVSGDGEPLVEGAGAMFGHATLIDGGPSGIGVRARETLLALRLPREAFARVAMQYPAMLMRISEQPAVARIAQ